MLWTAAAAALPVIVTVLVLAVLTLGVLVFTARGFDSLFAVVAVEWLVVNRVPLTVDMVGLGFLPLLPALLYVAMLSRQTRAVLADVERPGAREAGAAVVGATVAGLVLTGLASLLVSSAASEFAVRETSLPLALAWTAAVGITGSGLGVWLYFRDELREILPMWVRGGIHLGVAFVGATWAISAALVLIGVLFAWDPIAASLEIGKGFVGTAALTAISVAYLPNVVMAGAALTVGGEAHLGEASYSVFALSRGPMPEVPLAAALPTTSPHWVVQGLLLVTVVVAAVLARSVAHWFRTTGDAVKATWLAAAIVAVLLLLTPVVAGGELGVLGTVGTGAVIAAGMALLMFGIIGSTTIALSLAGLTRRRERAESELARRRRRAGVAADDDYDDDDGNHPDDPDDIDDARDDADYDDGGYEADGEDRVGEDEDEDEGEVGEVEADGDDDYENDDNDDDNYDALPQNVVDGDFGRAADTAESAESDAAQDADADPVPTDADADPAVTDADTDPATTDADAESATSDGRSHDGLDDGAEDGSSDLPDERPGAGD
ncbi:hypothetical protein NCCP2495_32790 [Dietzia sp. NCCP-2495]|nr:hypothetical protein NCCP2495_32790 [Dietzia sp. NCCP-2495]